MYTIDLTMGNRDTFLGYHYPADVSNGHEESFLRPANKICNTFRAVTFQQQIILNFIITPFYSPHVCIT
jgi:hypothetical protein